MNRRTIFMFTVGLAGVVGWYLFRPELLFITHNVNEQFPVVDASPSQTATTVTPDLLTQGNFHGVAHDTKGKAGIYRLPDGQRVLRLSEFATSNGPDVQVYLVAAQDANDNDTVTQAGFLHLGALKGNIGDQNYEVPADADLNKYQAVTVWCRRFGVNFGTAPMRPEAS